jgi:hypothetical protein
MCGGGIGGTRRGQCLNARHHLSSPLSFIDLTLQGQITEGRVNSNLFYLYDYFSSALSSWELQALYIHTHTTGYATWVTLESRLHNSGENQSFPVSFSWASFSSHYFILHFFSARFLSFIDLNRPSEFPIIKFIKICSILMVEEG